MSFSSRRLSDTRPIDVSTHRRPIRWLCGALIASCGLLDHAIAHSSRSYLAFTSPLPLRFAPPPAERGTEPTPPAPHLPERAGNETLLEEQEPSAASVTDSDQPVSTPSATSDLATSSLPHENPAKEPPSGSPPAILPDDLSYRTTAEDFLPYFVPPQLPSAPPSRATFQQR